MTKPTKTKSKKQQTNQVRIIGGLHKRRLIEFVAIKDLRPTPDRLRETLFNWLMGDILGARVLDVCAGSGILAFESLSRGAKSAILIEYDRTQVAQLAYNAKQLKLNNTTILSGDSLAILPTLTHNKHQNNTVFDIVFIDPPYSMNFWQPIIELLIAHQLIHPNTLLYIESDKPINEIIKTPLTVIKSTKIGQIYAHLSTCQIYQ